MRKSDAPPPDIDQLRKLGYEKSDVSLPILTKWLIFLFGFIAFSAGAGWVIFKVFVPGIGIEETPSALARGEKLPPSPVLQANPKRDIVAFRKQEEERADHYGWLDKDKDAVHIPLDRAIELVAERGFPSKADADRITVKLPPNIENEFRLTPEERGAPPPAETAPPPPRVYKPGDPLPMPDSPGRPSGNRQPSTGPQPDSRSASPSNAPQPDTPSGGR